MLPPSQAPTLKRSLSRRLSLSKSAALVRDLTAASDDGTPPGIEEHGPRSPEQTPTKSFTRAELLELKDNLATERQTYVDVALEDWKEDYPDKDHATSESWRIERNIAIREFDESFAKEVALVASLGDEEPEMPAGGNMGAVETPTGDVYFGLRKSTTPSQQPREDATARESESSPPQRSGGGGIKAKMAALAAAAEASTCVAKPKEDYALSLGTSVRDTLKYTRNDAGEEDTNDPYDDAGTGGEPSALRDPLDLGHAPTLTHVTRAKSPSKRPPTRGKLRKDAVAVEVAAVVDAAGGVDTDTDAGNPFAAATPTSDGGDAFKPFEASAAPETETFNPFGDTPAAADANPFASAAEPQVDASNPFGAFDPTAAQPGKAAQKSLASELQAKLDKKAAGEKERFAQEEAARVVAEQEAVQKKKEEAGRVAAEEGAARLQNEQDEADRVAAEQETARVQKEKEEAGRVAAEQEAARAQKEREEAERVAAEQEAARVQKEREEADRAAVEQEAARAQKEREEADRVAAEQEAARAHKEREEADRVAAEQEAARTQKEKEEADRVAAEQEAARAQKEKEEADRVAAEQEAARAQKEKEEADRVAAEQEAARVQKEKEEVDRVAAEQEAARVQKEKEEVDRVAAEQEAARAQKEKEEAARVAAEQEAARAQKEREEADRVAAEQEAARVQKEKEGADRVAAEAQAAAQEPNPFALTDEGEYSNIDAGSNVLPADDASPFNPFAATSSQ